MARMHEHRQLLRVRYRECDPMGIAHHSAYLVWFEMGRTELCRAAGVRYRDLEDAGRFIAVADLQVRYRRPVRYDEEIMVHTRLETATRARLVHAYEIHRDGVILTEARSTVACVDREGRLCPMPDLLMDAVGGA
jgi:acyl-CoA thioester hydrolase